MQIVKSWFNTMDKDGWIPREQILGPEARSKVPAEFQVQYPHYANPPTLFFVLGQLIDKIDTIDTNQQQRLADDTTSDSHMRRPIESNTQIKAYLRDLYPLLVRHFEWFRRTQRGEVSAYDRKASHPKEAYRWRGSTETHILTSGMDDYPRAKPPHPGELHVDLLSWMGLMARNMHKIASALEISDDAEKYNGIASAIVKNIDDLHWSEKHKTYCDASIDAYEESYHVCHKGYLSLFPFMTGLMDPQSTQMGALLDLISDPAELWSSHGIRSLSKKDQYYGIGENYWRSPVWMNMNYLIVRELRVRRLAMKSNRGKADMYRTWAWFKVRIKKRLATRFRSYAGISSRRSTSLGKRRALRGSNIIQTRAPVSARSTLRAGPVSLSKSCPWRTWIFPDETMTQSKNCDATASR